MSTLSMKAGSEHPASVATDGDVVTLKDVMVTMRDGIRLATDIYLPARDGQPFPGPFPVVMERTPYGKAERSRAEIGRGEAKPMARSDVAAHFVRAGYAVVYQDCRGRYGSEGEFVKYVSDAEDGYDTCAWIVTQPWCNGRIGTMGLSYAAHTQAALASLTPPGLACMILDSGGFSNAFQCGIRQGGAFELKQATWAYNRAQESPDALADPVVAAGLAAEDLHAWFRVMPWSEGRSPVRWVPEYETYLLDQWRAGSFGPEWKRPGLWLEGFYDAVPDIPILLMSSWYDVYVKTTFDNFAGLGASGRRHLNVIMGPSLHGNRQSTFAGDVSFGEAAPFDGNVGTNWLDFRRRWFDRWLRDEPNGLEADPTLRLFLMGGGSGEKNADGRLVQGGRWIEASNWPLPGTERQDWYIHGNGQLSRDEPAADAAPLTYDFDPADPVPTIGGALTSGQPIFEGGGFDQREGPRFFGSRAAGMPLIARRDVLAFESMPLEEDMAVVGPITVELWVASDAPDTDFTAKLVDMHPPSADYPTGFALNLTDGIFRCRYRNSWEEPEPIEPEVPFRITIEPFATATLFKAGHRIRLDISSSNFPKFDVNPNTFDPEGRGRRRRVARNTILCDAKRPSRIIVPVVPLSSLSDL
ncbi:CocE/NonD family hydrolase [Bosea sp. TAF32]|uniref:CocE/NonD family hydrolase n=1 Tax=Bosea sp. TAF32 TaxID=3237482 RepID=UPI003F9234BD